MGQNTDKNTLEQKPLLESAGSGLVSIFKKKDKVSHGPRVAVGDDFTTRGAPTRRTPVPPPPNSKSCPACPPPPCPPPPCPPPDFRAHQPDTVLVSGDHIKVVNATTCGPTTYVVNSVPYDVKVDKDTMTGDGVRKPIAVNVFTGKLPGLVPKANNDQKGMFLRSDGKWVANNFDVQAEDESITVRVTTDAGNTTFWLKAKRDIDSIFYGDETTTYAEWLEAADEGRLLLFEKEFTDCVRIYQLASYTDGIFTFATSEGSTGYVATLPADGTWDYAEVEVATQEDLAAEIEARKASEEEIRGEIQESAGEIGDVIANEIEARETADAELLQEIQDVAADVAECISQEAEARTGADAELSDRIDSLESALATETDERIEGDNALEADLADAIEEFNTGLDTERAERIAADEALQEQIHESIVEVDSALDPESRNPVENRVVTATFNGVGAEIDTKQDILTEMTDDEINSLIDSLEDL